MKKRGILLAGLLGLATLGFAQEKPYNIVWYTIGGPQKDTAMVFEELSKYTLAKINATVTLKQIDWGDYSDKMRVIIASGEPYDICFTCSWANDYIQNATKGAFLPLDSLLKTSGPGILTALNPSFLKGIKVKGQIYAIPTNKELGWAGVWRFNKKYLDQYKLDITKVKSLESLEPLLKVMKAKEPGFPPLSGDKSFKVPVPELNYVIDDGVPFAVYFDTKDYKVVNPFQTPEMLKMLKTMSRYYQAGYIRKDVATLDSGNDMQTGKWFVDKADSQPYADLLWTRSLGYEVVSTPIYTPYVDNSSTQGSMMAISVTSKNPKKVMEFLNLLNTDPQTRTIVGFGVEGVHYTRVSPTVIKFTDRHSSYDMPNFSLGNLFVLPTFPDEPADKWEGFKKFNAATKEGPLLGLQIDIGPVKNELAAIRNVAQEFNAALYTGSVDPDVFVPKYLAKLKASGWDKVAAEFQKQINTWRAAR